MKKLIVLIAFLIVSRSSISIADPYIGALIGSEIGAVVGAVIGSHDDRYNSYDQRYRESYNRQIIYVDRNRYNHNYRYDRHPKYNERHYRPTYNERHYRPTYDERHYYDGHRR